MTLGRLKAVAAGIAMAALALTGCSAPSSDGSGDAAVLTLGTLIEPTSFDPNQAQEGHFMQFYQAAYDSLIRRAPDGGFEPMLATAWEFSEDGMQLTLTLRDDVTFSDGAVFDAEAAKANLEHFRTGTGPQGHTLAAVESIDVVDDHTIAIDLSVPEPALLIYLSNAAGLMGSPEALGTDEIKTNPVGSGPYVLDASATTIGSQYTFVKNEDYWAPELQQFDRVVFSYIPDITARYNALASGQVDAAILDAKTASQADAAGLVPHIQGLDWQGLILFDRAGQLVPALGDVRVRQAINHAIDKEAILAQIQGGRGELTDQVFGPNSTGFVEELEGTYAYDPARAGELIAEAGYADGFAIDMPIWANFDQALAAVIREQLGAVGITVNFVEVPAADALTEMVSGRFPATWMSLFQPSSWTTINQAIAPTALFNALDSTDPAVTDLITRVQFGDETEAAAAAAELGTYLVENAWFAPWYRPDQLYYGNDSVDVVVQVEQAVPSLYNYSPAS
ncbi:ABC transporter substrate-binding protein [Microbacterium sp. 18062]|uniref:ABC transporter substrate-binding protein n=1 Tax=Microbacterium sp. 18062 TaxID=2681410 RepID=UPI001356DA2F|nr:ABC transporter substrate-binding protein [Microbacterium sp. 18062]